MDSTNFGKNFKKDVGQTKIQENNPTFACWNLRIRGYEDKMKG